MPLQKYTQPGPEKFGADQIRAHLPGRLIVKW